MTERTVDAVLREVAALRLRDLAVGDGLPRELDCLVAVDRRHLDVVRGQGLLEPRALDRVAGHGQQMAAIARGLMARPRLLILDEPSLGLAPIIVREMFESGELQQLVNAEA